jgi:hypothetical protein
MFPRARSIGHLAREEERMWTGTTRQVWIGVAVVALVWCGVAGGASAAGAATLVEQVRDATRPFHDVDAARAAGYAPFLGCVSGPQEGAMGLHLVHGGLVGDGVLDAERPEALMYEARGGRLHLAGVEYLVLAEAWDAANAAPPTLGGQAFHYTGSPNRYGIPAFYALHVWAWKDNPRGPFADWNPRVSCEDYTDALAASSAAH